MASLVACSCICHLAASANHATLLFSTKAVKQDLASRINHLLDVTVHANDGLPLFRFESQLGAAKAQKRMVNRTVKVNDDISHCTRIGSMTFKCTVVNK